MPALHLSSCSSSFTLGLGRQWKQLSVDLDWIKCAYVSLLKMKNLYPESDFLTKSKKGFYL